MSCFRLGLDSGRLCVCIFLCGSRAVLFMRLTSTDFSKINFKVAFGLGVFCPILRLRFSKTFFFFHAFWSILGVATTVHALFNEQ